MISDKSLQDRHPNGTSQPKEVRLYNKAKGELISIDMARSSYTRSSYPSLRNTRRINPSQLCKRTEYLTPHVSLHNLAFFGEYSLEYLDWPGNSPDLNTIKPCWPWIKWVTTKSEWSSEMLRPSRRSMAQVLG